MSRSPSAGEQTIKRWQNECTEKQDPKRQRLADNPNGLPTTPSETDSESSKRRRNEGTMNQDQSDQMYAHDTHRSPPICTGIDLVRLVETYVKQYMSQYDASHDYEHIERVMALAWHIWSAEMKARPESNCEWLLVHLASLTHDIDDPKYSFSGHPTKDPVAYLLLSYNACPVLANKVQTIVTHVSYSNEIAHKESVKVALEKFPELAIVQDADRLDAMGAVGVGRAFTFGAARRIVGGMDGAVDHFVEKLEKLEQMMKTETGKHMANERTRRLKMFRDWWDEECGFKRVRT